MSVSMSNPDVSGLDNPSMSAGEVTDTAVVARRLGFTPETIRRHLRRGTLPGVKVMSRWRVLSSDLPQRAELWRPEAATGDTRDVALQLLSEEVTYLREQLGEVDRERAELRQLLAQAQAIIARLISGLASPAQLVPSQDALPLGPPAPAAPEQASPAETQAAADAPPRSDAVTELFAKYRARSGQASLRRAPNAAGQRTNSSKQFGGTESVPASSSSEAPESGPAASPSPGDRIPSASSSPGTATIDAVIASYLARGWRLSIKLDRRAELAAPMGGERVYLEEKTDGTVGVQKFRDGS